MNIWNIQPLVAQLKTGPLPEEEQFKYFAVFVILAILGWSFPIDSDAKGWLGNYGLITWLAYGTIGLIGLFYSYAVNRRLDNKHFVGRFVALSLPITMQLFAVMFLALVISALLPDMLPNHSSELMKTHSGVWNWFWFSLQATLESAYFLRIASTLKLVARV